MRITDVRPITDKKSLVETETGECFCLYQSELKKNDLFRGAELSEDDYYRIKEEILLKRAKKRALYLLQYGRKTEGKLQEKLARDRYPRDIVEEAVAYVKSFGYLDDDAYVRDYVDLNKSRKSRKEMVFYLRQKGVPKELIDRVMQEEYEPTDPADAIRRILQQKGYDPREKDEKKKQKILGYLVRKGFSFREIKKQMELEEETYEGNWDV